MHIVPICTYVSIYSILFVGGANTKETTQIFWEPVLEMAISLSHLQNSNPGLAYTTVSGFPTNLRHSRLKFG